MGDERTVLVVEDEPGVRLFVESVLARYGYASLMAGSAEEALRVAGEHAGGIGVLVSDLILPDMHGRTLASQLRVGRPDLPVVFISGYSREDVRDLGTGRTEFVEKPFRAQELVDALRRALHPNGGH